MKKTFPVNIKLLGDFSIEYNGVVLNTNNLSKQICNLIAFLIMNRGKSFAQETTIEAIWPEGVNNPVSALKNLVYRFRKQSEQIGFEIALDLIISSKESYILNPKYEYNLDVDTFAKLCTDGANTNDIVLKASILKEAVAMYKGDLLVTLNQKTWTMPISVHYNNMFLTNLYELLDICDVLKDYETMKVAAEHGISINTFEEKIHRHYMVALSKLSQQQQAINHYLYISELFFSELGVKLTAETREAFTKIAQASKVTTTDIVSLKNYLNEKTQDVVGATYCELEVFKQVYRFEARSAARSGNSIFIGMFTLAGIKGEAPEKNIRDKAMTHLHAMISDSLRKSDIFSRCSASQYVVMLSMINFENSTIVLDRIEKAFKTTFHSRKISIYYNLQPLDILELI